MFLEQQSSILECFLKDYVIIRIRMSFIARYVYTYEEFVFVTVAPRCNRMTATGQTQTTNEQYTNRQFVCTGMLGANLKCNKYVFKKKYNSVVCSTFNIECSWDGLPEGRNCFCVWLFWCSELCSVDQTVTVQRGSVLDVRVQSDFASSFAHSW